MEYTRNELLICQAARQLVNGEVVFVGIGLPNLACNLARHLHAPDLVLIYESGTVGSVPERVPVSIGDPALVSGALSVCPIFDVFYYYLQAGRIDVGFLQGAQIDRYGNLNTTVIGDYASPKVRLPGSGGACEIAIHANKVLVIAFQGRRSFPEKLDFLTSAGYLDGAGGRERLGMPGQGPAVVIMVHLDVRTAADFAGSLLNPACPESFVGGPPRSIGRLWRGSPSSICGRDPRSI